MAEISKPGYIQASIAHFKSQAALAKALGYEDQRGIAPWVRGDRPLPPQLCVQLERASEGVVKRWHIRPDDWHLIWPELIGTEGAPQVPAEPATVGESEGASHA